MTQKTVMGVDLGTTCSSVTCFTEGNGREMNPEGHIRKINKYPREPARAGREPSREEVPSKLWYEHREGGRIEWGYQVIERRIDNLRDNIDEGIYFENFKLLLDDSADTEEIRRDLQVKLDVLGKSKIEVIADYLEQLLDHARIRQKQTKQGCVEEGKVQLVITIPAIWTAPAIRDMEEAATLAARRLNFRMDENPFFVYEPDAAARYVSTAIHDDDFSVGETFTVCDAGGGTVDLRTFTVVHESPPRHEPAVIGVGAACGSSFLDENFSSEFKILLQGDPIQEQRCIRSTQATADLARLDFEINAKRRFCHSEERPYKVDCPGLVQSGAPGFRLGCYLAESGFLFASIFMPVISRIFNLIEQQLHDALLNGHKVSKVFLMGGFADSRCLSEFLRQKLEAVGCELIVPEFVDTAIAQGALFMYLERNNGPSDILKTSYAYLQNEEYVPELHGDVETRLDNNDGKEYVDDCLHFFFQSNQRVPPEGFIYRPRKKLILTPKTLDEDQVVDLIIYSNERLDTMLNHLQLTDMRNHGSTELKRIEFTLTKGQLHSLEPKPERKQKQRNKPRKKGQKTEYYFEIDYEPVFTVRGANMWFELFVRGKSMALGHQTVTPIIDLSKQVEDIISDEDEICGPHKTGQLETDMTALSVSRV